MHQLLRTICAIGWLFIQGILLRPLNAQSDDHKSLTINTKPLGALVELSGGYTILAQTPFSYSNDLNGPYRVRVSKPGFESWQKTIYFKTGESQSLSISLSRKTPLKTLFRAAGCPGWGHFYSERKAKGLLYGTTFWLAFGYSMLKMNQYSQTLKDYNTLLTNFNPINLNNEEYENHWQQILRKNRQANDAFKSQKFWLWCTATIYLMNLVDVFFLYPNFQQENLEKFGYSISATPNGNGAQVALSLNF